VIRIEIGRRNHRLSLLLRGGRLLMVEPHRNRRRAARRFRFERRIGRWPVVCHWAAVLGVEACRGAVGG